MDLDNLAFAGRTIDMALNVLPEAVETEKIREGLVLARRQTWDLYYDLLDAANDEAKNNVDNIADHFNR